MYTIDFTAPLNIASTGVHLQIAFTETQNATSKVAVSTRRTLPWAAAAQQQLEQLQLQLGTPSVPEPSSMALLGLGVLGFAMRKRWRSKQG